MIQVDKGLRWKTVGLVTEEQLKYHLSQTAGKIIFDQNNVRWLLVDVLTGFYQFYFSVSLSAVNTLLRSEP